MSDQPVHSQALPEGTRLQEFELRRFLGAGGFGIAYLGWNAELDIPVAIKEYLPSDCAIRERSLSVAPRSEADEDVFEWGLDRFLEEARVLARFRHRSIVQIYRFFRAHGTGYIAMEYVEGQTLSEWLKGREPLAEAEVRGILLPLLDGLEEVHRAGVMHRDIKPGNIMLRDEDGSPVLLDFGAARQTVMAKSRSVTAILTPGYAPVEQYSEKGRQGPWTDIYALGALCHRMLAGEVPEEASNRILEDTLEPLEETCQGRGSPEFLRAVDWALRVRQEDRPQGLGEWRMALDGGHAPERREERKEREPAPGPIVKPKRKRAGKLAAGLALALLAAGGGYFGWMELEERRAAEEAVRIAAEEEKRRLEEERKLVLAAEAKRLAEEMVRKAEAERKRREAEEEERRLALEAEAKRLAEEAVRRMAPGKAFRELLSSGGEGPQMAVLPAGSFRMGCLSSDDDCVDDEKPVHEVWIARPFAVSVYEVTFEDYDRFARASGADMPNDRGWGRGRRSVINVSWEDAQTYAAWLSAQTGAEYRLLSEAEWEYAARAGSTTKYSWGDEVGSNRANCDGCGSRWDNKQTAPVGSFGPNGFGLYDMHGNVWEWVADCWNDSYEGAPFDGSAWMQGDCGRRVLRGGSWYNYPGGLRSANRYWTTTVNWDNYFGFRVARTLAP